MPKKILISLMFSIVLLMVSAVYGRVEAATLGFDKAAVTVNNGNTFDISVTVDAGSDQVSSTDAYVIYDATLLEADAITAGGYFPTVVNNITPGRLYIAGLVDNTAGSKTGAGNVATITFKALKIGTGTLTFDCQTGVYNSSKVVKNDLNATNIVDCSQAGKSDITVIAAASGTTPRAYITPYNGYVSSSSALPRSGVIENLTNAAIPGAVLLIIGGALRLIL